MGKYHHPSKTATPFREGFLKMRQIAMKKMKLIPPALILLCVGLFVGYQAWNRINADNKAPEVTIGTEILELSVSAPKSDLLQDVTALDDQDGDVSGSMVVEGIKALDSDGTMEVSFAAFDRAGNVAKGIRTVRYTDYEPPRFSLSSDMVYAYGSNFDPMNDIGATDPLDGDLQHRIHAISLDDSSVASLGDHEVEFRVTNSLGDTVRLTLPVTVYVKEDQALTVELTDYLIYLKSGSHFDADDYLASVTFGRELYTVEEGLPSDYSLRTTGTVDTHAPGVYSVDYTVTYTQETYTGNNYISGLARLIVIVEE